MIQEQCKEAGVQITREAVQLLIGKVQGNTRLIAEETRKLCTFAGAGADPINERMVVDLVPNFGDADFFEAADAFFSLKLDWTLEALRGHFFTNNDSRGLLGSLQSRNRLLIQLRVLLDAGAIQVGGRGIAKSELEAAAAPMGSTLARTRRRVTSMCLPRTPGIWGAWRRLHAKCRSRNWSIFRSPSPRPLRPSYSARMSRKKSAVKWR